MKARSRFLVSSSRVASVLFLVHIVEVWVLQGHLRRDPSRRLVLEHFPKQVVAVLVETRDKSGQLRGLPLRVLVPVGQLANAWPHLLIRGAKQLEDMQELLQLRVPRE